MNAVDDAVSYTHLRLVSFAGMTMEVKRSLQRNILRFTCVQSLPNVTCPIAVHLSLIHICFYFIFSSVEESAGL